MTMYELRQIAAVVYGAALVVMEHAACLEIAHLYHAVGDDDGELEATQRADRLRQAMLDDYVKMGGKMPEAPANETSERGEE